MTFDQALKSFLGYLEGTDKSAHTIKNYKHDVLSFREFYPEGVNSFYEHLKAQGLKTNTRRRKLMTVHRFLGYLVKRNKLPQELGKKIPTPLKVERIPLTVSSDALMKSIRALPSETLLDERNRVMFWVLAETGCQVSEVSRLRFEQWSARALQLAGQNAREIPVSTELTQAVRSLQARSDSSPWLFLGHNKFGSLGGPISPRGVELLVKHYAEKLGQTKITPRTFRHSVVLKWHKEGCSREEIQKRLGLKTAYAFRVYEPLFKSKS